MNKNIDLLQRPAKPNYALYAAVGVAAVCILLFGWIALTANSTPEQVTVTRSVEL